MGFFDKSELTSTRVSKKGKSLGCINCGLSNYETGCKLIHHSEESDILILYGKITNREKNRNMVLSDSHLKRIIKVHGLENVSIVPVVQCYSDIYTDKHYDNCKVQLEKTIAKIKPKLIIAMGHHASRNMLCLITGTNEKDMTAFNKYRGCLIPYVKQNCMVQFTYCPKFAYNDKSPVVQIIMDSDIKNGLNNYKFGFPDKYKKHDHMIKVLKEEYEVIELLRDVLDNSEYFCFDYETSGLKPHNPGHFIYSASWSVDGKMAYAFLFPQDKSSKVLALWKAILIDTKIKKIAQNMKFEHQWTREILGYEIVNWYWDTMVNAHIIDNRIGITSLKHQSFILFGIKGYEEEVKPYFVAKVDPKDDSDNAINRIRDAPVKQVLYYNGCDSLYEYWLYEHQVDYINKRIE